MKDKRKGGNIIKNKQKGGNIMKDWVKALLTAISAAIGALLAGIS